jgi:hypothetical protein
LIEDDDFTIIKALYSDDEGLYIKVSNKIVNRKEEKMNAQVCVNGHPVYHHYYLGGCGGCAHPWCNFRCKCHMPWNP